MSKYYNLPPKNNCFNCGNADHEVEPEGIECLLHGWYFPKYVAVKSTCDKWVKEEILLDDTHEDYCSSCGMNISVEGSCDCEREEED